MFVNRRERTKQGMGRRPCHDKLYFIDRRWTVGSSGSEESLAMAVISSSDLETVDLDSRLLQAVLDEERRDLGALVSLQLNDLTHLLVLNKGTVAGKLLRGVSAACC